MPNWNMDATIDSAFVSDFKELKVSEDHVSKCNNIVLKNGSNKSRSGKNDIYIIYRKEALEMASLASQHFKAATEAFLKKDHLSAKQHSMIAREEIRIARELNCQAAAEILKVKNRKNNIWRIDLHGLHGTEAIQALRDRLDTIESEDFLATPSNQKDSSHTKQLKTLQVITGVGKHSQGKPVLPIIVRNFLIENKYHFEEIRPGVLKVWPNFHHAKCVPHQVQTILAKRNEEAAAKRGGPKSE